ncbi:hypothetical protein EV193_103563 [Herbihabitans rhizosphaerae]|uniref:Integral membrane protein n=1 Tax=Herbihabitans rhizosphaerae TaxID=1872711 RepID=A0A4Q7KZT4_9PSEU|nr:hypothetical protein [Herbihabitans rhizosphaerae]RZS41242.1 hypothetical protein EV193_103563 [Herbihabitans rhizosphaerae]
MSVKGGRGTVEEWFRRRGLPLVVRRKVVGAALLQRSTPLLVFLLALDPILSVLARFTDVPQAEFDSRVANSGYVVALLGLTAAALIVPVFLGWLVAWIMRRASKGVNLVFALVVVLFSIIGLPALEHATGLRELLAPTVGINALTVLAVLAFVYTGLGSILAWALRAAMRQFRLVGQLTSRALPLLMLVVLFSFFAAEMWQMAGSLPRWRMWAVVAFLIALGVLFLSAITSDELRELGRSRRDNGVVTHLAGTPLDGLVPEEGLGQPHRVRFTERANLVLVFFFAQALQIAVFGMLVFGFFLVFGALSVTPEVAKAWSTHDLSRGELFGLHLPVSNELVQVSLFLSVFSALYFAATMTTDPVYRKSFFDPLIADMRVSLAAREVYLARWGDEIRHRHADNR